MKKAIIFDVDGVLLDSLPAHLAICEDLARRYKLDVEVPFREDFVNNIVRKGIKISPMYDFFIAVGFDKNSAKMANEYYKEKFSDEYSISPFIFTAEAIKTLKVQGYKLGIVTSNVMGNIIDPLDNIFDLFDPELVFAKDSLDNYTKQDALGRVLQELSCDSSEVLYVGDQHADGDAARDLNIPFVGVTYGWGITKEDTEIALIDDLMELTDEISSWKE